MTTRAEFSKWQGLGNDYLIVAASEFPLELTPERVRLLCDRHFGVGGDGILAWSVSAVAGFRLEIYNPDGSRAEMCGNGIRMLARHLYRRGLSGTPAFTVETDAGLIRPQVLDDGRVRVEMGQARVGSPGAAGGAETRERLDAGGREYLFTFVDMGNPHCVVMTDDLEAVVLEEEGAAIERHQRFPGRTNVEFVRVDGEHELTMRVWERGVGETRACGTGACAAAVAAAVSGAAGTPVTVHLPGGDLEIEVADDLQVVMTGPAEELYSGVIAGDLVKRMEEL